MDIIKKNITYNNIEKEFVRKSIHMTIATIPSLALINTNFTIMLLLLGSLFYITCEFFKSKNIIILSFVSSISEIAARDRDHGITLGPLTLAFGAIVSLIVLNPVAAACGIYALAFGDGLSSITGKLWGKSKIPFTNGKSYVGFFTCFTMILSTSYGVTGSFQKSILAALGGAIIELIPIKDIDNILIPLVVGFIITVA